MAANKMDSQSLIKDLFKAYYCARKNKRNSKSALSFEMNFESKLFELFREIKERRYEVSPNTCFIVFKPVKREIFAGDFRDRIVHHLLYNYLSPIFERYFIFDSYSCRIGKGTFLGVKRADYFIRSGSGNYKKDAYILKLDIQGYFMSIDRKILYYKVIEIIDRYEKNNKLNFDKKLIIYLLKKVIFNDPIKNCIVKGSKSDWAGLPKSKSLFYSEVGKGLPIGNLTSQLFSNVYLNDFDYFVKHKLKIRYYGRYVDDFILIHNNKEYLKKIIPEIRDFLKDNFGLILHPKKIYFQHYYLGVKFLGTVIKPYRIYIGSRTKGNFYKKIYWWKDYIKKREGKIKKEEIEKFAAVVNSYLGGMKHCKAYKLRKNMLYKVLSSGFGYCVNIDKSYDKISLKNKEDKK